MARGFSYLTVFGAALLMAAPVAVQAQDGAQGKQKSAFDRLDKDGDGAISASEAKANAERRMENNDINDDGKVTEADIDAQLEQVKENNPEAPAARIDQAGERLKAQFDQLDTNGDGVLSKSEYEASAMQKHKKLDQNDDGKVTQKEVRQVQKQIQKKIQQRREQMKQQMQQQMQKQNQGQ